MRPTGRGLAGPWSGPAGPCAGTGPVALTTTAALTKSAALPATAAPLWSRLLPDWVAISAGSLDTADRGDARSAERAAGCRHVRAVLAQLGCPAQEDLEHAPDRALRWPAGVVGSLSHARAAHHPEGPAYVVAAAALRIHTRGIGVDVDRIGALAPEHWPRVLTGPELRSVLDLSPPDRPARVLLLWCAKEAVMKAWRTIVDPLAVDIDCVADGSGFQAQAHTAPGSRAVAPAAGRLALHAGLAAAAVVLPP